MKVILFGAGASYGAGEVFPDFPPLGNQLFSELAKSYPRSWGAFPPAIKGAFEDNFENGMQILWNNHSHVIAELMQQMALYFIQFRPRIVGSTLYCSLSKEIKSKGLAGDLLLSTLNYDCLLERSLSLQGLPVNYGHYLGTSGSITVSKLHGSCNMLPYGIQATRGVSFTRGVLFNTQVRFATDPNDVAAFCLGNNALPPVMCLYMKSKPVQVSPSTISEIQEEWRNHVLNSTKIFIIGVNPNPEDKHLWNAIASSPAEIVYVGNEGAFSYWSKINRSGKPFKIIGRRFDESFNRLITEL